MHRRDFLASSAGAVAWLAARARGRGDDRGPLVYVGTYTDGKRSEGIYRFRVDPRTGTWRPAGASDAGPNPSFLALHPRRRVLYAVNEVEQYEGAASGAVSAFAIDARTGDLTLLDRRATRGGAPCYVSVAHDARTVLVANYVGGNVAAFPLDANGRPGDAPVVSAHEGSGPRTDRQQAPHAHCILPDPSGRFALSADLGADRIYVYGLGGSGTPLAPAAVPWMATRPGAGPRHIAFHPSGRFAYITNELELTVSAYRFDPRVGALAPFQTVPAVDGSGPAERTAADVHVAPSGRFLYASVRGDDVVAVFAIDARTGALTLVERVPTGGHWPRNFALDPSGRFLYAANQRSDSVVGFQVDAASGRLTPSGFRVEVPAPVCVVFHR